MDALFIIIPFVIFFSCEYYCMKMILPQLENKQYFRYFDRTTWMLIILVTTIIGYLFYMYIEGDQ